MRDRGQGCLCIARTRPSRTRVSPQCSSSVSARLGRVRVRGLPWGTPSRRGVALQDLSSAGFPPLWPLCPWGVWATGRCRSPESGVTGGYSHEKGETMASITARLGMTVSTLVMATTLLYAAPAAPGQPVATIVSVVGATTTYQSQDWHGQTVTVQVPSQAAADIKDSDAQGNYGRPSAPWIRPPIASRSTPPRGKRSCSRWLRPPSRACRWAIPSSSQSRRPRARRGDGGRRGHLRAMRPITQGAVSMRGSWVTNFLALIRP